MVYRKHARRAVHQTNIKNVPFVKTYIVPLSGFVGVEYGMDLTERGWRHLDHHDYGPGDVDDAEYARLYRERDHSKVVTREMVERAGRAQATAEADEGADSARPEGAGP